MPVPDFFYSIHWDGSITFGNVLSIISIIIGLWQTNRKSKKRVETLRTKVDAKLDAIMLQLKPVPGMQPHPESAGPMQFTQPGAKV